MTAKTIYTCDLCSKEVVQSKLLTYKSIDACDTCVRLIYVRVFNSQTEKNMLPIVLRPWCKHCAGTGKIRECVEHDPYGHNRYENVECQHCKIT